MLAPISEVLKDRNCQICQQSGNRDIRKSKKKAVLICTKCGALFCSEHGFCTCQIND